MIIKTFDTIAQFQAYTPNGLKSGVLYCVNENKSVHFATTNISGEFQEYHVGEGVESEEEPAEEPVGTQGTAGTQGTVGTQGTQGGGGE